MTTTGLRILKIGAAVFLSSLLVGMVWNFMSPVDPEMGVAGSLYRLLGLLTFVGGLMSWFGGVYLFSLRGKTGVGAVLFIALLVFFGPFAGPFFILFGRHRTRTAA